MDRWSLIGAILFGCVYAFFAFWRVDTMDSHAVRGVIAFFLFGFYCALVAFGTAEKKRTLSLAAQTVLGVALAMAIAALFHSSTEGYALAAVLGLIFGFTADWWVQHVNLP